MENEQLYREVAERLKDTEEVKELVNVVGYVDSLGSKDTFTTPFIALENSSGMGKTQMAYNLSARDDMDVFYIVYCKDSGDYGTRPASHRSATFFSCVKEDFPVVGEAGVSDIASQNELRTYGFIWALLMGNPASSQTRTRDEVWCALKARQVDGRCCVFFLDEYPPLDYDGTKPWKCRLRFIRNVFRSFGLVVIVSSTHGTTSDLIRTAKDPGKRCNALWCIVFPLLPHYQDPLQSSIRRDLREIIEHSRPLFATQAVAYAKARPLDESTALADYMDGMVEASTREYFAMKKYWSGASLSWSLSCCQLRGERLGLWVRKSGAFFSSLGIIG